MLEKPGGWKAGRPGSYEARKLESWEAMKIGSREVQGLIAFRASAANCRLLSGSLGLYNL
jgi:hypothetical protein